MYVFLLMVVAGYVGMQLYIYWKLRQALPARRACRRVVIGALVAIGLAFFLSRAFEARGWHRWACVSGLVGHWWVVASMWFVCMGLAVDAWNLALWLAARWRNGVLRLRVGPRALVAVIALAVVGLSIRGFMEPWEVRLEKLTVRVRQLVPGSRPIRVVQLSDLHLNALMSRERLAKIVARIREAQPDLLVFTGDLADQTDEHVSGLAATLAELEAPLGKLAVTGNHEFYRGLARAAPLMRAAGFNVLHGQCVRVAPGLLVAGVDDYAALRLGVAVAEEEDRILPPRERADFVILLKHRPYVEESSVGRFDLQLSGHIHGGQVFPARLPLMLFCRYSAGWYNLGQGSALYVSRGAGTFGVPMRLLSPPEVTLIVLEPTGEAEGNQR